MKGTSMKLPALTSLTLLVTACGGSSSKPAAQPAAPAAAPAPVAGTYAVPALPGEVTCFGGPVNIELASGNEIDGQIFLRRAWDAATSTIAEDTVLVMNGSGTRTWSTAKVVGTAMTIDGKYDGGVFKGTGTGTGTAPFTAWQSDLSMDKSDSTVKTTGSLSGAALTLKSIVSDAKKVPIMQYTLTPAKLDAAACDAEFSKYKPL